MPDFEDACPYEFKGEKSRAVLVEALNTLDFGGKVIAIRPNNIRSKYFLGDVQAIVLGAPDRFHGIILPKTETPEDIVHLSRLLDALEEQGGWTTHIQIEALIETPLAVVNAYSIAKAPRYCGPDHPVTQMLEAICYGGDMGPKDRCLATYELNTAQRRQQGLPPKA